MFVPFREKKICKVRRSENFEFDLFDFETGQCKTQTTDCRLQTADQG